MSPSSSAAADHPSLKRVDTSQEAEQQDAIVGGTKRTQEEVMIDIETVTDEEVEEFCAILRRLRRPVKYFGGGVVKRWRPSFMAEDFNYVDGGEVVYVKNEKKNEKGDGVGGSEKGFDLNVGPLTE